MKPAIRELLTYYSTNTVVDLDTTPPLPIKKPELDNRRRRDDGHPTTFACPFWKFDSSTHKRCFSRQLTSISYLKQHLKRDHTPSFYCRQCFLVFTDEEKMNKHARLDERCIPTCEEPPFVTTEQWRDLWLESKPRPPEESWFQIYELLFPGQPWPSSAYLDQIFSADFREFYEFAASSGSGILQDVLGQFQGDNNNPSVANNMPAILTAGIDQIFYRWMEQMPTISGESVLGRPSIDSMWSQGTTLATADTPCPCSQPDFGGKKTCFKTNRLREIANSDDS